PNRCRALAAGGWRDSWRVRAAAPREITDDERERDAHPHHYPGAALGLAPLERATGVPDEVADAGDQVIAVGRDERGAEEPHERVGEEGGGGRLGGAPGRPRRWRSPSASTPAGAAPATGPCR